MRQHPAAAAKGTQTIRGTIAEGKRVRREKSSRISCFPFLQQALGNGSRRGRIYRSNAKLFRI
jgi:hypothetical protein